MGRLAELQRKQLESLMGAEAMGIITTDVSMWDPKTCRPFTTGICPNDLFTNTKMDLGSCARTHSVKVKNEYGVVYAKAEAEKDLPKIAELNRLKVEYEHTIHGFVEECDRRIRAAQRRLEKTPEENNRTTALMREIGEIEGAFQTAMAEVEQLGSEGKVDESMKELVKAEALKSEKEDKEKELQQLTETSGASGHQKLRVCDICGAYLSILDSDRRLADHFGGKMHLGYLQLRQYMDEWKIRGALPTAIIPPPSTSSSSVPNGPPPINGNNWSRNAPMAPPAAPKQQEKPAERAAPASFRPIVPGMNGTVAPPPLAPTSPAHRSTEPSTSSRDRGERSDRDRSDRSDRDRSERSSRRDDERSSSRRDDDRERSSRRHDDRDRDDRDRDSDRHRSSRRHDEERSSRHSSSRRDEESSSRRSDRRELEEGEERPEKEKRRRVD